VPGINPNVLTAPSDCVLAIYAEQGWTGTLLKGRGWDMDDIRLPVHSYQRDRLEPSPSSSFLAVGSTV